MKIFYRIQQAVVIVTLAVLVFFFLWGLSDGTVSGANMLLWLALLAIPAGALFGGNQLWTRQRRAAASALLAIPAPALFFGLFALLFMILQPDMK